MRFSPDHGRSVAQRAPQALSVLVGLVVGLWLGVNAVLNLALPALLNRADPQRFHINYDIAWMWFPGWVQVYGLEVRGRSAIDTWQLEAQHATGRFSLTELFSRRFHAWGLQGEDVRFHYVPRKAPLLPRAVEPWSVILDDVHINGIRELAIAPYRAWGDAELTGRLAVDPDSVRFDVSMLARDIDMALGDTPVASNLHGWAHLKSGALQRDPDASVAALTTVSGIGLIEGDVADLSFLDRFLGRVPWLTLSGDGHLVARAVLREGRVAPGTFGVFVIPRLGVRFLKNEVVGPSVVRLDVATRDAVIENRLTVDVFDFEVLSDAATSPLARGPRFRLAGAGSQLGADLPMPEVSLFFLVPDSEVPDVRAYNAYFPDDVGVALQEGKGRVRGWLAASAPSGELVGDFVFAGAKGRVRFGTVDIEADYAVHAVATSPALMQGEYHLGGTSVQLSDVTFESTDGKMAFRDGDPWWATTSLTGGRVHAGKDEYFRTTVEIACASTDPLVAVLAGAHALPRWTKPLVAVRDVRGRGDVRLSARAIQIEPARIEAGPYEVNLELSRQGSRSVARMEVRYGALRLGIEVPPGDKPRVRLVGRDWFDDGT